jgi:hypothetical protein
MFDTKEEALEYIAREGLLKVGEAKEEQEFGEIVVYDRNMSLGKVVYKIKEKESGKASCDYSSSSENGETC